VRTIKGPLERDHRITVKESKSSIIIEAVCCQSLKKYVIRQPLGEKDKMLKIYKFSLYNMLDNMEIQDDKLVLFFPVLPAKTATAGRRGRNDHQFIYYNTLAS
jgi:hypothetical protein